MTTYKLWVVGLLAAVSACTSAGDRGLTGDAGPPGAQGSTGAAGVPGPTGPAGATGATGAQGSAGATGASGVNGAQGPTGVTGATGPQGPAGPGSSGVTKAVLLVDAHGKVVGPGPAGFPNGDPYYFDQGGFYWTISETDATFSSNSHWEIVYGQPNCQGPGYVGYYASRVVITIATLPGYWAMQDNPGGIDLMAMSQTSNGACANFGGAIDVGIQYPVSSFTQVPLPDAGFTVPFHLEWR
jgi:hypothetical protein